MAYGWGVDEPVIKPIEEGGDNINQYAQKIKDALNTLYVELRQDIVRATLAESIAATDIKKIITPSTAFRTYYGATEPSNLQGKNNDTYIRYGDIKDTYIKVSGSWQKIDAIPQPATLAEVNAGTVTTKYVTPQTMNQNNKSNLPGGFPRLDGSGLLPYEYSRVGIEKWDKPGTYTWKCPAHVKFVLISGCGGGGGGGGGTRSYGSRNNGGAGGGAGATILDYIVSVVPGTTYTITIGGGGVSGYYVGSGGDGGSTKFGSLLTLGGGEGGEGGAPTSHKSKAGTPHFPLLCTDGGIGANSAAGSGGSTIFGLGGVWVSVAATPRGQEGQGKGAGGSGGYNAYDYCYGSAGAPGLLILKWAQ